MVKRILAVFTLGCFFSPGIFAAMISFMVIETGLPEFALKNPHSERWETSLLDVFFDAGHIVSNAPILRLASNPQNGIETIARPDIDEAAETGADYFLIAQLDFTPGSVTPHTVYLLLFRLRPFGKIYERQVPGRVYASSRDESDNYRVIIRGLVPHLVE